MTTAEEPGLKDIHTTAWMIVGALVFALTGPWLLAKGIFWDGALYATIARNMAAGIGEPWDPIVTSTFMRHFREHPPLAIWLQALCFRVVGDHFWVERVYSLATALVTLPIFLGIWRRLLRDVPGAAAFSWLTIVLWAPFGAWCYRHNMLENTLGIFTGLSIYASLRALDAVRGWAAWSALAGVAITAGVLSKGPVGLFPAVTPAIAWIALRRASLGRALLVELAVLACCAGALGLALIPDGSREYLAAYWQQQVVNSMLGHRERVASFAGQLNILILIVNELQVPVLVGGCLLLASRMVNGATPRDARLRGPLGFCLLTALSASLPLVASPKQSEHYAAPSWPFYIFAVVVWCLPAVRDLLSRAAWLSMPPPRRLLRWGAGGAIACTALVAALNYGRCMRDPAMIRAVDQLASGIPPQATLAVSIESWNRLHTEDRLKLHVYLYRYHSISLFADELEPAFKLECHRLRPPDLGMVMLPEAIQTDSGLVAYLLVARENADMAAAPSASR